jgi:phage repressor protein C with HTH and peptisase S24 domain
MICSTIMCNVARMAEDFDLDTAHGRLGWARVRAGYADKAEFADAAGVNKTTYRAYENGQNGFAKLAASFGRLLGVSAEWLLDGGEEPTGATPAKPAPAQVPVALIGPRDPDDDTVDIIQLDLSLSMGPGTLIEEFIEEERARFGLSFIRAITRTPTDRLRIVRGIGDSMEPTLRTGDRVLIDINEKQLARMNGIYWVDHLGTHGLKRLRAAGRGRVMIASDNPHVPDFEVDAEDLRIEGRAIWFARDL